MAFGEAVFAEALDLFETSLDEIAVIAAADHSFDKFLLKNTDISIMPEGRHGATKPIRFIGCKFGSIDGDLHRLLLEKRNAQSSFENIL